MNYKKETRSALASLIEHSQTPNELARIYFDEVRRGMPEPAELFKKLKQTSEARDLLQELYSALRTAELAALKFELDKAVNNQRQSPPNATEQFNTQLCKLYHDYYAAYTALRYSRNPWRDALDLHIYGETTQL